MKVPVYAGIQGHLGIKLAIWCRVERDGMSASLVTEVLTGSDEGVWGYVMELQRRGMDDGASLEVGCAIPCGAKRGTGTAGRGSFDNLSFTLTNSSLSYEYSLQKPFASS